MYKAKITAVGYHVPEKIVTNTDLEKIFETSDEWIRARTGIRERRHVAQGEATSDLAAAATCKLLEKGESPLRKSIASSLPR